MIAELVSLQFSDSKLITEASFLVRTPFLNKSPSTIRLGFEKISFEPPFKITFPGV